MKGREDALKDREAAATTREAALTANQAQLKQDRLAVASDQAAVVARGKDLDAQVSTGTAEQLLHVDPLVCTSRFAFGADAIPSCVVCAA